MQTIDTQTTNFPDVSKQIAAMALLQAPEDSTATPVSLAVNSAALRPFESLRITDKTAVKPPVPIITIGGEIISTPGNITTISGPSKSGKSALTSPIIAGAISPDGNMLDPFEELFIKPNEKEWAVIQIDTEQAKHKQQQNLKGILCRAGLKECPPYLLSYNFRSVDLEQYRSVTEAIFKAAHSDFGGIHLAVVDGIADYIDNVNNAQQSNSIVKFFESLAITYSTAIIFIVHTNPGSDKERGHLGSQCQRKSESVLTIKNSGNVSYIIPKLLRMAGKGDVPQIQYRYDDTKGYHVSCGFRSQEEGNKTEERRAQLLQIAEPVFPYPTALPYKDAIAAIMKQSGKQIATAKTLFSEMKTHEIIRQTNGKSWGLNPLVEDEGPDFDE